ncbi:MAG: hypothetical protein C9356_03180 [Oleiphilus sp.]|nr:MAG: hypothetical protein C9356_03180 [Oleiphilus sp.]
MAQQTINIVQEFNAPVEQVFEALSDHENFGRICGIKMKRIKDGEDALNGLGSVRKISIGPLPSFEETITDYEANALIEYKITQGSPIKNHVGTLRFSSQGESTVLNYTIQLESKIPFTSGLIKGALENGLSKGLSRYAQGLKT